MKAAACAMKENAVATNADNISITADSNKVNAVNGHAIIFIKSLLKMRVCILVLFGYATLPY